MFSQIDVIENQQKQLRHEVREFKVRENRNLGDYAELEEENISLQKQVCIPFLKLLPLFTCYLLFRLEHLPRKGI